MCSDVVVGAYGSDRAVLLRTRSVLDLQARFDISPSWVSHSHPGCTYRGQGTACLKATVCLKYSGINLPPATGQQAVTLGFYTPSPSPSPPLHSPLVMKLGGGGGAGLYPLSLLFPTPSTSFLPGNEVGGWEGGVIPTLLPFHFLLPSLGNEIGQGGGIPPPLPLSHPFRFLLLW